MVAWLPQGLVEYMVVKTPWIQVAVERLLIIMGEAAGSCLIFLRLKPNCKFQDSRQENQGAGILSSPFGFLFLIVQF